MAKLISLIFFSLIALSASSQELVKFVLTPEGKYVTPEGEDFIVVPFEGKTASDIYSELLANITAVTSAPYEIAESIIPSLLVVRVKTDDIIRNRSLGKSYPMEGSFLVEIKIKDDKVRVSAPRVSPYAGPMMTKFDWFVKNHFNKKGEFKDEKRQKDFEEVQAKVNNDVNIILNLKVLHAKQAEEEDW